MVKSQNKNKNKKKAQVKQPSNKGKSRTKPRQDRDMSYPRKVLELYRDPCSADLVYPPYEGTDAGYLARTVDIFQPTVTPTVSGGYTGDYYLSWTPWNYGDSTGYIAGANAAGSNFTVGNSSGPGNFISSSVVNTYRPVAACLEWVPTDQVLSRSGTVSFGYLPTVPVANATVANAGILMPMCMNTCTNGFDKNYSMNWLPSMNDERFTTSSGTVNGVGTVFALLSGVQLGAVAASGVPNKLNGFFRVTTVWEWTPERANGLVVDPRTPSGWSVSEVLARAGDIKKLLYGAADIAGAAMRFASRQNIPGYSIMY